MSKEDFDLFWKTHLVTPSQGCSSPETTILYWHTAKEETSNFPWTRREGNLKTHATAAAVRDLLTQVRVATRKNVVTATMIQNYSPCSRCVDEILKTTALAKEKRIKLEISISFVALNGIRRQSWVWRGFENVFHKVTINESNDNSVSLRQLQEAGVKVTTFDPDTWKFLYTFLGNGLCSKNPGKFLNGKFANVESRLDEDRLMEADLKHVLRGLTVISSSNSSSNSSLNIEWCKPSLIGEKVSDYRVICKKVTVKNKDDDDRSWRILQTVDNLGVKVIIPGELTSFQLTDLELDTFYDVTVEAMVKGLSTCMGRKIFRTGSKAPIPSLQTPTITRKLSSTARPRTSSTSTFSNGSASASATRLQRSNSIHSAPGISRQASPDLESEARSSRSVAARYSISAGADFDPKVASNSGLRGLHRTSSLYTPKLDRQLGKGEENTKKMSDAGKLARSEAAKGGAHRKITSSKSFDSTML